MKKVRSIIIFIVCVCLLTACSVNTYMSFVFNVETGDQIKVKLTTSEGHSLSSDVPFAVSKDDKVLSQGKFIYRETIEKYEAKIKSNKNALLLDSGKKDGNDFLFWKLDNEYNHVILVDETNTAIVLFNNISKESAEKCFNLLEFEKS